eukprot:TRINITY_DN36674_c2_g2_i1.p1 TRINITY_DN36674_c2_g2~~TRINITY_DN36674_c2_g2_i1.p1  ORF type:complete len:288 (+),score=61.81 TRINITY_DN36674_c2_g2_i1:132-866(+)
MARKHFIALQTAWETMSNKKNSAECSKAKKYGDLRDTFAGSTREAWIQARANRMEEQKHLEELLRQATEVHTWSEEQREVLRKAQTSTYEAVQRLETLEIQARMQWEYHQAMLAEGERIEAKEKAERAKQSKMRREQKRAERAAQRAAPSWLDSLCESLRPLAPATPAAPAATTTTSQNGEPSNPPAAPAPAPATTAAPARKVRVGCTKEEMEYFNNMSFWTRTEIVLIDVWKILTLSDEDEDY